MQGNAFAGVPGRIDLYDGVLHRNPTMENAHYGWDDQDFMLGVIFSVASAGWVVMSAEKLLGGRITIHFEKESK